MSQTEKAGANAVTEKKDSPPAPNVENRRENRMEQMRRYFAEQPRETIRVRKELGDQTVRINGYGFRIQAGAKVKVPVDVAEILRDAEII
jgi:hypothetical protein